MNEREALKLALEALEEINKLSIGENAICLPAEIDTAMDAIKEALAQPEQRNLSEQEHDVLMNAIKASSTVVSKGFLAQPEQEQNKNGSPCPEFWDWLPKAYNFEGDGNFTKYNMEVAFLAGKQSQPQQEPWEKFCDSNCVWTDHHPDCKLAEQEPVAWMNDSTPSGIFARHIDGAKNFGCTIPLYITPPQRTWVGLTDEEREEIALEVPIDAVSITEAKLKEKNSNL